MPSPPLRRPGRGRPPPAEPAEEGRADILALARRLEIRARRLVDSRAFGAYESVFRGHGIEFAEVREYEPGDPFQSIDWKVSARMGRPFVKRFVEEKELSVLLAVDLSASTAFGTRGGQKRDLALEVASVLALAANWSNDRIGLLLFTDRMERFVPPARGRNRVRRLLYEMARHRPEGRGTDLRVALECATRLLRVRSMVFVLSDFQGPRFERELGAASRRHEIVAIHVRDPAEERLPPAGLVEVVDPETGETGVLDLASPRARRRLVLLAKREERRLQRLFVRARCDRIVLRTDRPYAAELAGFLGARSRLRLR